VTAPTLTHLPGRCAHGFHVATQGCASCGVAFKFAGQAKATAAHPSEAAAVEAAIRQLAATRRPFSANDARQIHGVKGGVVGATFTRLRKAGVIEACGDETSSEPGTHGHRIFLWRGCAR
jgi:hypothetical protein